MTDRTELRIAIVDAARKLVCGPAGVPSNKAEALLVELGDLIIACEHYFAVGDAPVKFNRLANRYEALCLALADEVAPLHRAVHAYDTDMKLEHADATCPKWFDPEAKS